MSEEKAVLALAVTMLLAAALAACAAPTVEPGVSPTAVSHGNEIGGYVELADALRGTGAPVAAVREVVQPFFGVPGQVIAVNGAQIQVFEYADEPARQADSDVISPDGYSIGTSNVTWIDQPNFWIKGRLIVLYVGSDQPTLALLSGILGEPITSGDQATVYAEVIRQLYTVDHTFDERPNFPILHLVRVTDDGVGDQSAPHSQARNLSASAQSAIAYALEDLPAEIVWVDTDDEVPRSDDGAVKDGGAIITLGNIHLQQDGSALVSASLYVAPLAATGKTYVLKKVDGHWQVTGDMGVQWIS